MGEEEYMDIRRLEEGTIFGWGTFWPRATSKLRIIQKPVERICEDCIQEQDEPEEKDKKQKWYHCWAVVGWNYNSELVFYEVPGNTNGEMSQRVYVDFILEPAVKPWLEAGEDFVLEEDGDSGRGSGKSNIVRD